MKTIYTAAVLAFFAAIPASGHDLAEAIADCACDSACYTDKVKNLSCTASRFSFSSDFMPDSSHALMVGATATNQNMPRPHNATASISRNPQMSARITETEPGAIGVRRQPIGYAADGFPILALGWFESSVHIEDALDRCRGTTDGAGTYFYNVETSADTDCNIEFCQHSG